MKITDHKQYEQLKQLLLVAGVETLLETNFDEHEKEMNYLMVFETRHDVRNSEPIVRIYSDLELEIDFTYLTDNQKLMNVLTIINTIQNVNTFIHGYINAYVVESENTCSWFKEKADADNWIVKIKEGGQQDISFAYATIKVNPRNKNEFDIIKEIDMYF